MSEPTKVLTNEYLKSIMTDAMVARKTQSGIDLNTLTDAGCYGILHSAQNLPPKANPYGLLITFCSLYYGAQIYISRGQEIFARTFIIGSDTDFLAWLKLSVS